MWPMNKLAALAMPYGISLSTEMEKQFSQYCELLLRRNRESNLTAITTEEDVDSKHFLDSLLLLAATAIPENVNLLDVGTGAGFPAIPLKIARPDLNITLLDSLTKRIHFLQELSGILGQENLILHGRAEEYARMEEYRENYAMVTARAVANLRILLEYCLPFVRLGGVFLAMKGAAAGEELAQAAQSLALLGGEVEDNHAYNLPDGSTRHILVIRKISQTPPKYPRKAAKITKSPL
jgi:16S rRNA (guanine(527)-N(7))-methyltransferase RsmG